MLTAGWCSTAIRPLATSLVTGANRGIGLAYCQQLHARGDKVIAVCRQSSEELDALGVRVESGIELTSPDSIAALVNGLAGQQLDTVILNAGVLQSMGLSDLDPDGIRQQFEVNALAPLLLARALIPLMWFCRLRSSRADDDGDHWRGSKPMKTARRRPLQRMQRDYEPRRWERAPSFDADGRMVLNCNSALGDFSGDRCQQGNRSCLLPTAPRSWRQGDRGLPSVQRRTGCPWRTG